MTRCFIGFLIPDEIKARILSIQKGLEALPMKCKFVEEENLHISLSFLGEVEDSKIDEISNKLDNISKNYGKIHAKITGIKPIPNRNYMRVLALGVVDEGRLKEISSMIEKEIGGDVKPPHLTLCRIREITNKNKFWEFIDRCDDVNIEIDIDSIQLIKSELKRSGPVYSVIHRSLL